MARDDEAAQLVEELAGVDVDAPDLRARVAALVARAKAVAGDGGVVCAPCAPAGAAASTSAGGGGAAQRKGGAAGRGRKAPPAAYEKDEATGKYKCSNVGCVSLFDTVGALAGHRRFCDGGLWRCDWCKCDINDANHRKNPGPRGPATLCGPRARGALLLSVPGKAKRRKMHDGSST